MDNDWEPNENHADPSVMEFAIELAIVLVPIYLAIKAWELWRERRRGSV